MPVVAVHTLFAVLLVVTTYWRFSCVLQGVQMITRKRLCAIKGISEAKVDKIKVSSAWEYTRGIYSMFVFLTLFSGSRWKAYSKFSFNTHFSEDGLSLPFKGSRLSDSSGVQRQEKDGLPYLYRQCWVRVSSLILTWMKFHSLFYLPSAWCDHDNNRPVSSLEVRTTTSLLLPDITYLKVQS